MKETFFTPIGTHQSPRKTRSTRRPSRRDCEQSESGALNSSDNFGNFSRNCWLRFSILYKKENQYQGKYWSMFLIMKYLAWNIFSQHYRFERKHSSSPNKERQRYEGPSWRSSDIRYQEELQKWRRTPQSGYEVGSSSQPDLYHRPAVYVNGADQYSQSLDYYQEQYHKYF